ncbi:sigma-70 family RNA polymerase sigma factor [bacterium]|nr:sigma-70 family RNA polymerase sigma factor [bacterium]
MNGERAQIYLSHTESSITASSEIELLKQARTGDVSALEMLYIRYLKGSSAIQALLRKAISRSEEREEMLHEIFLQLVSGRHAFRGESQLKTYIYQVARITIFQKYRKENTLKRGKAFRIFSELWEPQDPIKITPESSYSLKQATQLVKKMIEQLPVTYRDVLRLRVMNDLSYQEIAQEMKLPLNTVSTKIHKGKKLLLVDSREQKIRRLLQV